MALSYSLSSDSESIDEMAHMSNVVLATQARVEEQTALAARLEERYTALQERYTALQERYTVLQERYTVQEQRYRIVIFFAIIIIAYFIWLVYFLLFTKLSSYTN